MRTDIKRHYSLLTRLHTFLTPCRHFSSISVIVLRIFFLLNTATRFVRDDAQNNSLFIFVFLFHTFPLSLSYFYLLPSFVYYHHSFPPPLPPLPHSKFVPSTPLSLSYLFFYIIYSFCSHSSHCSIATMRLDFSRAKQVLSSFP